MLKWSKIRFLILFVSDEKALSRRRDSHWGDRVFQWILKVMAWAVISILLGLVVMLLQMASPAFQRFGFSFFAGTEWNPAMDIFGALPSIFGTLCSSLLSLVFAIPVSLGVALFLTQLAPKWMARILAFLVEMLAAVPSVVYGLWGVFILSPFMQSSVQPFLIENLGPKTYFAAGLGHLLTPFFAIFGLLLNVFHLKSISLTEISISAHSFASQLFSGPGYGVGLFTSSIVLAIMIIPTISAISREVFATVQPSIREAALALGATRWEMIRLSVIKSCRAGILGAIILGLGRALGETMAVTMVIGNRSDIQGSLFAPAQTMASLIANEYPEATGVHMSSLALVGLALLAVSLVINAAARWIIWRVEKGQK